MTPQPRYLFIGDSITAADRDVTDPSNLGGGFVHHIAQALGESTPTTPGNDSPPRVLNYGIGGQTTDQVRARWQRDALSPAPDVLTLMIGINDTWRVFSSARPAPIADYEADLRAMVGSAREAGHAVVLMEPFLLPLTPDQWQWRPDLDARIAAVRRTAWDLTARLVPSDGLLNAAVAREGVPALTTDGVHLTRRGERLLAQAWLDHALG